MNSKIYSWLLLMLICKSNYTSAQQYLFSYDKKFWSLGYSAPAVYNANLKTWQTFLNGIQGGSTILNSTNPLYLSYEKAKSNHIGVGVSIGFQQTQFDFKNFMNSAYLKYHVMNISTFVRGTYHPWALVKKRLDPYVGIGLGYNYALKNVSDPSNLLLLKLKPIAENKFLYNTFVGARWMKDKIGIFGEVGYSNTHFVQAGLILRFGPNLDVVDYYKLWR